MDEGDTVHILLETTSGVIPVIMLGEETTFYDVPQVPVILDVTDVTPTSFTANWKLQTNTSGYYLDVAEDPYFTIMVAGYTNLDVEFTDNYPVVGLASNTDYFCRIRAYNDYGTSANSATKNMYVLSLLRCLVRNAELNNSLSLAASTLMIISDKVGQVLTVNLLPDYGGFDEAGWTALLIDEDKTNAADPNGDYLYRYFCTIDRVAKTITFPVGYALTEWTIGDTIAFYNPYLNYSFVGDQSLEATIPVVAGTWKSSQTNGAVMFRHSNGRFIMLYSGYDSSVVGRVGYAYSVDMQTWTMGNGDNWVFDPTTIAGVKSGTLLGACSPLNDGTGRYYCLLTTVRTADNHGELRILYFNEDLTTFTYSAPLLPDTELGFFGGSILKIDNEYHLIYMLIHSAGVPSRSIKVAKSATLEGAYVNYQEIASGITANTGVSWSRSTDAPAIYEYQGEVFGFFGSTAYYSLNGTKGNRVYSLIRYDRVSGLWIINKNNATLMNPMYFYHILGDGTYFWCWDHSGGATCFVFNEGVLYASLAMHGNYYQTTIMSLNLI